MNTLKTALFATLAVVLLLAALFGAGVFNLEMKRFFKPRNAEIDRQVFENTPSFVHGKAQYIERLRFQYEKADTAASRAGLKTTILHEASTVDWTLLPANTQAFLNTL